MLLLVSVAGWRLVSPSATAPVEPRSEPRDTWATGAAAAAEPPLLRGHAAPGVRDTTTMEDVEGGATLKIEDPLLALMGRIDRAWDTNLSLVEGTPGVTRPELNRFIASNDDLYAQWLAVYLAFEGPTVAPRDLIALDDLRRLFAAYRAAAPSDDPAYALLATTESRLAEGALRQLDVDLQDEVLPSLHDLLG